VDDEVGLARLEILGTRDALLDAAVACAPASCQPFLQYRYSVEKMTHIGHSAMNFCCEAQQRNRVGNVPLPA